LKAKKLNLSWLPALVEISGREVESVREQELPTADIPGSMVRRAAGVQVDQGPSRRVTRGLIDRQYVMDTFLKIFIVVVLALAFIGWLADRRAAANRSDVTPGLSLLPGDIKYESSNGNVRVYFPIVTSIVLSVVLTLILRVFS